MLNHKTIKTIIILAFCLVALVGAEEKGETKIEPKLVYEKRFDFEIEEGRIGKDGSVFPTIFVTKDNRILFFDKSGIIHKEISFTCPGNIVKLSEDGKYVIIAHFLQKSGTTITKTDFSIYDSNGKKIVSKVLENVRPSDILLTADANAIILFHDDPETMPWGISFYDGKLNLLLEYSNNDFELTPVPGSHWRNPGYNRAWLNKNSKFLVGTGSKRGIFGLYVFDIWGTLKHYEHFDSLVIGKAMVSKDGNLIGVILFEYFGYTRKINDGISKIVILDHQRIVDSKVLSEESKGSELLETPIVFSENSHFLSFTYLDTVFLYNVKSHKLHRYSNLGFNKMHVLDCFDNGNVLLIGENNYVVMLDERGEILIRRQVDGPILDAVLSQKGINIITSKGLFIFEGGAQ